MTNANASGGLTASHIPQVAEGRKNQIEKNKKMKVRVRGT
jgi:hypothetical protein